MLSHIDKIHLVRYSELEQKPAHRKEHSGP